MKSVNVLSRHQLSRRTLLKGAGVALSIPWLSAMVPAFAKEPANAGAPKRFVAMCAGLGFHKPFFIPEAAGRDYKLTRYLEILKPHIADLTVFSGMAHQEQNGANGHTSEMTWLTAAKHPGLAGFRNTISVDQLMAERIGHLTRVPYLAVSNSSESMSWTAGGVQIPGESSPARLFAQLFIDGSPSEVKANMRGLQRGRSVLDTVGGEAQKLNASLGHHDQAKLDQYLTSVRELELRLTQAQEWVQKPKPKVEGSQPKDITEKRDASARIRLMNEMIVLALQTDSTRIITYRIGGMNQIPIVPGVTQDWHNLSHHGQDESKIAELGLIEAEEFSALNDFMNKLKQVQEGNKTVFDNTAILYGSNLGNASAHDWRNLPLLLAGGGFKHGQHLAFDAKNNLPFSNLFVQLLNRMDIPTEHFGTSTATTVPGLV